MYLKRFEQSSRPDIALYKNYLYLLMCYHTPGDDFVNKICCHISLISELEICID